jgi:hypothetical protein
MKCLLCGTDVSDAPSCWACGYDVERNDARPAIARIKQQSLRANVMWLAGVAMVFLAPAIVFQSPGLMLGLFGGAVVASGGVVLVTFGLINGDRATKRLAKARERTQLPAARVIE